MNKIIIWILRIIVGALFIFSGVVKANDPLGLSYKTQEFFEKMNLGALHDYTLILSVIMIALEILAGVAIIIGYKPKITTTLLLLLIAFFTYLTSFALFKKGPDGQPIIHECGCFGDCFKLSNWETFYKDVALFILILILFIFNKYITPLLSKKVNGLIILTTLVLTVIGQNKVLNHLPFVDCLPYKKGASISEGMKLPAGSQDAVIENIFIYEKGGKKQEFSIASLPDSTWTFVDRIDKVVKEATGEAKIKDFVLSDENGNDVTQSILEEPSIVDLWFVKDLKDLTKNQVEQISKLYEEAVKKNEYFYLVASFTKDDWMKSPLSKMIASDIQFLTLDGTVMKTALRSNTGLIVLKQGVVLDKYSKNDLPNNLPY